MCGGKHAAEQCTVKQFLKPENADKFIAKISDKKSPLDTDKPIVDVAWDNHNKHPQPKGTDKTTALKVVPVPPKDTDQRSADVKLLAVPEGEEQAREKEKDSGTSAREEICLLYTSPSPRD